MSNTTTLSQKASSSFLASADVFSTPFSLTVGDVLLSTLGSNLTLSNSNVTVFSSNCPAALVALPTNIKLIKDTSNVTVRYGNSNVLRANANRFSPSFSNGSVSFSGSSYSNAAYAPTQVFENPGIFTRDISAPNLTLMNGVITSTSNALVSLSNSVVPQAAFGSNLSVWSSNNLIPKSGGTFTGDVAVRSSNLYVFPGTDTNQGIRVIGNNQDGASYTTNQGGFASWFGVSFKCLTDNTCRFVHNCRNGDTSITGTMTANAFAGGTITSLSNATVFSSNASAFSSNSLFPKTGGNISGFVNVGNYVSASNFVSTQEVIATSNVATRLLAVGPTMALYPDYTGFIDGALRVSSNLDCFGDMFGMSMGLQSNVNVPGAALSGGLFTVLGHSNSTFDGANAIAGNVSFVGNGNQRLVVNGTQSSVPAHSSASALYVKGGIASSNFIKLGAGAAVTMWWPVNGISIGTSTAQTKSVTVNLGVTLPTSSYQAMINFEQDGYNDVFVGKIDSRSTTGFTMHVSRVNGTSWGTAVNANVILYSL